jgi:3-oxoacid CoA-transferase subunit A
MIGDLHGSFKPVRDLHTYLISGGYKLDETDTLICLGDVGANFFFNHRDSEFKKKLRSYNLSYFVVRGNHEERPSIMMQIEPEKWEIQDFWGGKVYVEKEFPYIKYALDYPSKYVIPNKAGRDIETLVIPGAYSVDKYKRLQEGWSWFPQEQLSQEEMDAGSALAATQKWDLILSHTCPICYEPTDLFLTFVDQSTVDKTMERWLGGVEYNLKYDLWCWGHYHSNRIYPRIDLHDKLMLFNDCVFDVNKYFDAYCPQNLYDCLIKVHQNTTIDDMNKLFE